MSEICSWNINVSVQSQNSLLLLFLRQNDYSIENYNIFSKIIINYFKAHAHTCAAMIVNTN